MNALSSLKLFYSTVFLLTINAVNLPFALADDKDLLLPTAPQQSLQAHNTKPLPAHQSIYFLGLSQHFESTKKTRDGNMAMLGYSRDLERKPWHFENGAATFIDSYNQRSYAVFSNISHESIGTAHFKPTLGLNCAYKGYTYKHNGKKLLCTPPIKFRIGNDKGIFAYLTPIPKIGGLTNGLVTMEVGYKF